MLQSKIDRKVRDVIELLEYQKRLECNVAFAFLPHTDWDMT